jgi:hypothetical protein
MHPSSLCALNTVIPHAFLTFGGHQDAEDTAAERKAQRLAATAEPAAIVEMPIQTLTQQVDEELEDMDDEDESSQMAVM